MGIRVSLHVTQTVQVLRVRNSVRDYGTAERRMPTAPRILRSLEYHIYARCSESQFCTALHLHQPVWIWVNLLIGLTPNYRYMLRSSWAQFYAVTKFRRAMGVQ
jgi:hypothetical protein